MSDSAYTAAVKMLARRELSEAQVRQRLTRKQYSESEVDAALERLTAQRLVDDARVAAAIARSETSLRRRGPLRIRQKLAAAGIGGGIADAALQEIREQVDMDALLAAALDRRLKGRAVITDEKELARLYRQLIAQGFDRGPVMRLLRARRHGAEPSDE